MKKTSCIIIVLITTLLLGTFAACSGAAPSGGAMPPANQAPALPAPGGTPQDGNFPRPGEYYDEEYRLTNGETYLSIDQNAERQAAREPLTTISLKVDTASYTNIERYIQGRTRPPADAVRTEELINYFNYDGEMHFERGSPFAIYTEIGPSPLDAEKYMAFIRVKSRDIDRSRLPSSNLTFLIDVSGSMSSYDKLPLLKDAFGMLVETLGEDDIVSVVTYSGATRVLLDSVSGGNKDKIMRAINGLEAGGSTAGENAIEMAYDLAVENFLNNGNNRVILATDGDFNVGTSSVDELEKIISRKRETGVYLSVLGFGTGNIRDDIMESLAKSGNGNYSYINSLRSAQKVMIDELAANLFTIADDVKAQVEFNPENVISYRLVGYENRMLNNRDFNDDTKDAGEIGVGTDIVVMFELELNGAGGQALKYSDAPPVPQNGGEYADELFEVRIRYKNPGESDSKLLVEPVKFGSMPAKNSADFDFACSAAAFGELLRGSAYAADITADDISFMAKNSLGEDTGGYRRDFVELLGQYGRLR